MSEKTSPAGSEPAWVASLLGDQMMELLDEAVALADANGTIVSWNAAASRMFGLSSADAIDRELVETVVGPSSSDIASDILSQVQAGQRWDGAWLMQRPDGSSISAQISIVPTFNANGSLAGVAAVGRDMTAHDLVEHELHASQKMLDAIVEGAGEIFAVVDQNATFRSVFGPVHDLLGVEPETLLGTTLFDLLPQADIKRAATLWARRVSTTDDMPASDFWVQRPDNTWCCLSLLTRNLLADPDIGGVVIRARDVTDHRQLAQARITLAGTNSALVNATSQDELFGQICRVLVGEHAYDLAWIGLADATMSLGVRMTGIATNTLAFFEALEHLARSERYHGPLTTTLESQEISVVEDIAALDEAMPWRSLALEYGYQSMIALPIPIGGDQFGVLGIYSERTHAFSREVIEVLTNLTQALALGVDALRARAERATYKARFDASIEATVKAIATAAELRDAYTAGHQRRVAQLAVAIATGLGVDAELVRGIGIAASIHDIGKLALPAEILSKPGRLTPVEYMMIKQHSQAGHDIVAGIDFPWNVAEIILQHHERLDGSGYPNGLHDEQITLGARVIAVADTVEAMQAHRPYRPAIGLATALDTITEGRDTLFDAAVVDTCITLFQERGFTFTL